MYKLCNPIVSSLTFLFVTVMDVPTITVFKSPPWHKPPEITAKIRDVYEEFPVKPKSKYKNNSLNTYCSLMV